MSLAPREVRAGLTLRERVLELVRLSPLMALTAGTPEVTVGLIDGPVMVQHPDLAAARIREAGCGGSCRLPDSEACAHGTAVAGILAGSRNGAAPAICPDCSLFVRPVFEEDGLGRPVRGSTPDALAGALRDCVRAGARVINVSATWLQPPIRGYRVLGDALDEAAARGVIVVVAAGNEGSIGGSQMTSHPSVIPVSACDEHGHALAQSNFGISIGRNGLAAPGVGISTLGPSGDPLVASGTSAAAPFVAGTIALLWSLWPGAHTSQVRWAILASPRARRTAVVPPLLDAWGAYELLMHARGGGDIEPARGRT